MTFRKGTFFNVLHADCLKTGLRSKVLILSIIAVVGAAFPMTGLAKDIPGTRKEIQLSLRRLLIVRDLQLLIFLPELKGWKE